DRVLVAKVLNNTLQPATGKVNSSALYKGEAYWFCQSLFPILMQTLLLFISTSSLSIGSNPVTLSCLTCFCLSLSRPASVP
ncbi:hypothetical protein NDU88_003164, partial [Pleurodeles waltl]